MQYIYHLYIHIYIYLIVDRMQRYVPSADNGNTGRVSWYGRSVISWTTEEGIFSLLHGGIRLVRYQDVTRP